jgi:hypothetical protein
MTETTDPAEAGTTDPAEAGHEVAYYYPEPYWRVGEVDSLKTLLLFFDEIAILLPRYMQGRETAADPVLAGPLHVQGLLRVLEPEVFVDQQMTEELSEVLVELITGDAFDDHETTGYYAELSRSRIEPPTCRLRAASVRCPLVICSAA